MIQMKSRLKDIKRYLWDVLLFSGIGCFSYFLLVYYADIPSQYQDRLMTFQAFSVAVFRSVEQPKIIRNIQA